MPKTLRLAVLLEPEAETIPEVTLASHLLSEPEALLEPVARTIAENKLRLEELDVRLENVRTEFKNALADMKGLGDRISTAVIERFTNVEHSAGEQDNGEDRIDSARFQTAEPGLCKAEGHGEEHSSKIGNDFIWNTSATSIEFSPIKGDSNAIDELGDILFIALAAAAEPGLCKAEIRECIEKSNSV